MSLFKESIQDHLTPSPVDALACASYPGMAHFARTGPVNSTCRECLFWQHGPHDYRAKNGKYRGLIEPATCAKYRQITMQLGSKIPDDAPACKYFDQNPTPPTRSPAPVQSLEWCGEDNRWFKAMMAFDAAGGQVRYWCGMPRCASAIPLTFALFAPDGRELHCNYRLKDIVAATELLKSEQRSA